MYNVDQVCDFKNEGTSITILYIASNDLNEIRKTLRQKRKQARHFFDACPIVVDFSKIDCNSIEIVDSVFSILKEEKFIPVGITSEIKSKLREDLILRKIPVYATNKIEKKTIKENLSNEEKETPPESKKNEEVLLKKIELTKNHYESVRGGQKLMAKDQNLSIFGTVNSSAEILASGSIIVMGGLNGRAAAGVHGDESATIIAHKFDAVLVSICGIYSTFEDGVPEEYKNKSVVVYLESGHIKIRKI